jgi:glycosyltransferase involved in cell wall biosynthesis
VKKRLALSSSFNQRELRLSSLFMHELLPYLEEKYEVTKFSAEPEYLPVHNISSSDRKKPFDYSLVFNEDHKEGMFYYLASFALPGVLVCVDVDFERLIYHDTRQFKDIKKHSTLWQITSRATTIAAQNEIGFLVLSQLAGIEKKTLVNIRVPCSPRTLEELEAVEKRLSVIPDQLRVGYFGKYEAEDNIYKAIESILAVNQRGTDAKLVWIVADGDKNNIEAALDFQANCRATNLKEMVELKVVKNFEDERTILSDVDVFLYLRKDLKRCASSAYYHAMTLGIPAVCLEFGQISYMSESVCIKVPAGVGELHGIVEAMLGLAANASLRKQLSVESVNYASLIHDPKLVAQDLIEILEFNRRNHPTALIDARIQQAELEAAL